MSRDVSSFRVGRVAAYRRGRAWDLCYHEHGRRRRPRVGPGSAAARQLAVGAPAALSFEAVSILEPC